MRKQVNRIAVIDLGTNVFNLLIADHNHFSYCNVHHEKIPVRLGEGGINQNVIQDEPFWRGINAIEKLLHITKNFEVSLVHAFATSAVRDAANGALFTATIRNLFGLNVSIIDGDQEAELIYHGVRGATDLHPQHCTLIMDIGGGSTEFIVANHEKIFWKKSYNLGVARMFERYPNQNPIHPHVIQELHLQFNDMLEDLFFQIQLHQVYELVGASGSFDSFAEMICAQFYHTDLLMGKTSFTLHLSDLKDIHQLLIKSTIESRAQMPGLASMRANMIVLASILVHFVLHKSGIKKVRSSAYSLKEGVIFKLLNQQVVA